MDLMNVKENLLALQLLAVSIFAIKRFDQGNCMAIRNGATTDRPLTTY